MDRIPTPPSLQVLAADLDDAATRLAGAAAALEQAEGRLQAANAYRNECVRNLQATLYRLRNWTPQAGDGLVRDAPPDHPALPEDDGSDDLDYST